MASNLKRLLEGKWAVELVDAGKKDFARAKKKLGTKKAEGLYSEYERVLEKGLLVYSPKFGRGWSDPDEPNLILFPIDPKAELKIMALSRLADTTWYVTKVIA